MTYSARPYIWDLGKPESTPGALITARLKRAFIPENELRTIADRLHDIADTLDSEKGTS